MPTDIEKPPYVVDASIAVKWFCREEGSVAARELLKRGEIGRTALFAPDLLFYEVGNALRKGKNFGAQDMVEALDELLASSIEFLRLDRTLAKRTAYFTEAYDLTFYDACYAALAYELRAPLVSENPKDHTKVKEIEVLTLQAFGRK